MYFIRLFSYTLVNHIFLHLLSNSLKGECAMNSLNTPSITRGTGTGGDGVGIFPPTL